MISRLNTPLAQIIILGFVAFCSPGMFNSLSGLGAGGRMGSDVALVDSANAALYACFAIVGFFAGSIVNTFGPKYTLMVSGGVVVHEINTICINFHHHLNTSNFFILFPGQYRRLYHLQCLTLGLRRQGK